MIDKPQDNGSGAPFRNGMQNQQSEHVKVDELIRTIECGENDVVMTLVRNEVDGPRLIVAHPNIEALEEIMEMVVDTSPEEKK